MPKNKSQKRKFEGSDPEENDPVGELKGPKGKGKKKWTHHHKKPKASSAPPACSSKEEIPETPDSIGDMDMGTKAGPDRSKIKRVDLAGVHDEHRLSFFRGNVDIINVPKTLKELTEPTKGGWEGVCEALSKPDQPSIAASTLYLDSSGAPIFAYFGQRVVDKTIPQRKFSLSEQYSGGRTPAEIDKLVKDPSIEVATDGITVSKEFISAQ